MSAAYNYRSSSIMADQLFIEDLIISTYAERFSHSDTWRFNGEFSKGLGHSKMVVGVEGSVSLASASSMRESSVVPFSQATAQLKPYFKGSILRWLSANYDGSYGFSRLDINNDRSSYHTLHQNLFATIIPNDHVQFTLGAEHFLTHFPEGNNAGLILLDASAVGRLNDKVRLTLTADNILDQRNYKYVNYGTLSRSEQVFNIRRRSILLSLQYRF